MLFSWSGSIRKINVFRFYFVVKFDVVWVLIKIRLGIMCFRDKNLHLLMIE